MNNDLISRSELKKALCEFMKNNIGIYSNEMFHLIDNAPTVKTYCYYCGQTEHGVEERPQGDIRWTDKLSVNSNGDIIDFEGRIVGHINLEELKGGAE